MLHEEYQNLFNSIKDAVFVYGPEGTLLAVNDAAVKRLGYTRKELLQLSLEDLNPSRTREQVKKEIARVKEEGTIKSEGTHYTKDGKPIPVEIVATQIQYHDKQAFLSVSRDITERKHIEKRSRLSDFSLDRASLEVFWINPEGKFVYTNETAKETLGYSEEELQDMYVWDIDPNYGKDTREEYWKTLKQEHTMTFESEHKTKEGTLYPVEITSHYLEFHGNEYEFVFAKDITKRKQAEERFRTYIENAPYGVFVADNEGNYVEVNHAKCEMTGYSKEELLDMNFLDLHDRKARKKVFAKFKTLNEQGEVRGEVPYRRKDGTKRYWNIYAVKITNNRFLGFVDDVTERKKTERKLREAVDIIDRSPTVAFTWENKEGWPVEFVSDNVKNVFGYTPEEFTSGKIMYEDCIHPDDLSRVSQEVEQFSEEEAREDFVHEPYRIKTKKGEVKIVKDWTAIIRDSHGNITQYKGIVQDITERQRTKEKLEMLHKYSYKLKRADSMQKLFSHTLDVLQETLECEYVDLAIKRDQKLTVEMERGFESSSRLRELPLDGPGITVQAVNTREVIMLDDVSKHESYLAPSPKMRSEIAVPIIIDHEVLGVLNVESKQRNAFNEKDRQLVELLASHVAVAIKQLREKKKRVSLQQLDELRNEFLSMAAHEINTPLTPIKSNLEMLERGYCGELTTDQKAKIRRTLGSVDRLKRLVDDFRRIAKLHTGQLRVEKTKHNLVDTVKKTIAEYQDILEEKTVHVVTQFPSSPMRAVYDEDFMKQVIQNIVENAIDYTEDTIWIRGIDHETELRLTIRDNGPGIPKDKQKKIFDPFYRVETDRARKDRQFGGTGLGLHICKRIMEAHQGNIRVDSEPGKGTIFTVTLPK